MSFVVGLPDDEWIGHRHKERYLKPEFVQQDEFFAGTVDRDARGLEPGRSHHIVFAGLHVERNKAVRIGMLQIRKVGTLVLQAHFQLGQVHLDIRFLEPELHSQMRDGRLLAIAGNNQQEEQRTQDQTTLFHGYRKDILTSAPKYSGVLRSFG